MRKVEYEKVIVDGEEKNLPRSMPDKGRKLVVDVWEMQASFQGKTPDLDTLINFSEVAQIAHGAMGAVGIGKSDDEQCRL